MTGGILHPRLRGLIERDGGSDTGTLHALFDELAAIEETALPRAKEGIWMQFQSWKHAP